MVPSPSTCLPTLEEMISAEITLLHEEVLRNVEIDTRFLAIHAATLLQLAHQLTEQQAFGKAATQSPA